MQRLDGSAAEAELAVVVVLDDGGVDAFGPVQQGPAPAQRHHHPERELVGRAHVDQPGVVRERVDDQAFGVDRHPDDTAAERAEGVARRRVAGVLDGDDVTRRQQHPRHQVDRLLAAARDQHVLGVRAHPARDTDVPGDRGPQRGHPRRPDVRATADGGRAELLRGQGPPRREREAARVRDARAEVELGRDRRHVGAAVDAVPQRPGPQRGVRGRPRHRRKPLRADEGARADPRPQEALRGEPVVGERHRVARHAQPSGQLPARRHGLARPQQAVRDRGPHLLVHLPRAVAAAVDAQVQLHRRSVAATALHRRGEPRARLAVTPACPSGDGRSGVLVEAPEQPPERPALGGVERAEQLLLGHADGTRHGRPERAAGSGEGDGLVAPVGRVGGAGERGRAPPARRGSG